MSTARADDGVGAGGVAALIAIGVAADIGFVGDVTLGIAFIAGALIVGRDANLAGDIALG